MNTASSNATSASSRNPIIAMPLPRYLAAVAAAVCAACTTLPQTGTKPPPAAIAVPETARAVLRPVAFAQLPGWADDTLTDVWPAFTNGCTTLVAQEATAAIWREPCAATVAIDSRDAAAVRTFFERHFTAYQALTPEGKDAGLATGYYEPLLNGSRIRSEQYRYPLYAPPDDLLTIDLVELYPELKDKRRHGRDHRWSARNARRSACGGTRDRRRSAFHPARRAGISRHHLAAVDPAAESSRPRSGYRRRDPGAAARGFFLGLRRRCGAPGWPHEAGRASLAALAEGRAAAFMM